MISVPFLKPAAVLMQTLWVGGGVEPRTPLTRTRSAPALFDLQRIEVRDHIRIEIGGGRDFIEQLCCDRAHGNQAAGIRMFGDGEAAVRLDFGDRITHVPEAGHFLKERVVATAGLQPAFDDVSGRQRTGQRVVVVALPAVAPGCGTDHHRRIGHPRTDHDIGAAIERFLDTPGAKVGVCGQYLGTRTRQRHAFVHVREVSRPPPAARQSSARDRRRRSRRLWL